MKCTFRHERPIRLGLPIIGNGEWRGGLNYQRTLLQAISGPLNGQIEACVFVTPDQESLAQEVFGPLLQSPLVVDERVRNAGVSLRAFGALLRGCDRVFAGLVVEHEIDVIFENARYFGRKFPVPVLAWLPDFQHRHLPHMFTRLGWWRREVGFRAQTNAGRTIMLSSATARDDCERFYPRARGRTRVVRFSPSLDAAGVYARVQEVRNKYELPDRFFFMPNQFWPHKNHALVLEALIRLRDLGLIANIPPVVMSGAISEHRARGLYDFMMARAASEGLDSWLRHVGLIPLEDVVSLNAGALAVLNPSLFEGWASSVEEAKVLGSPLILSDIPVHREQAPHATFFKPHQALDLANALVAAATSPLTRMDDLAALSAVDTARKLEFVRSFEAAVRAAYEQFNITLRD